MSRFQGAPLLLLPPPELPPLLLPTPPRPLWILTICCIVPNMKKRWPNTMFIVQVSWLLHCCSYQYYGWNIIRLWLLLSQEKEIRAAKSRVSKQRCSAMMPQYAGLGPGYVLMLVRGAVSAKHRRRAECRLNLMSSSNRIVNVRSQLWSILLNTTILWSC